MEDIYIIDGRNNTYAHMCHLRQEVIDLIHHNVCKMGEAKMSIRVSSAPSLDDVIFAKQQNLSYEDGLYDKLIIEYNQAHPAKLLEYWPRHK